MALAEDSEAYFRGLCQQFDQAVAEALALELEAATSNDPVLQDRLVAARNMRADAQRAMLAFAASKRHWQP